jgi:catechol 2,3-dioxygenase-like lactoylglutathione lyase family enzyme
LSVRSHSLAAPDTEELAMTHPALVQTVLDTTDPRRAAEFWRQLLGLDYRPGDEQEDPAGDDWLVLRDPAGANQLAFQKVDALAPSTWPDPDVPQQLHLDLRVPDIATLDAQHERVLALGGTLRDDSRQRDPDEPLRVYADPDGHPFCIFVG